MERFSLELEATEVFYGKNQSCGLVELSMPAPLYYAYYDGIRTYSLALCDPPTGGPTYCRPLSGCRLPEASTPATPPADAAPGQSADHRALVFESQSRERERARRRGHSTPA